MSVRSSDPLGQANWAGNPETDSARRVWRDLAWASIAFLVVFSVKAIIVDDMA